MPKKAKKTRTMAKAKRGHHALPSSTVRQLSMPAVRTGISGMLKFPPTDIYGTDGMVAFTKEPKGQFDPRSFRTIRAGARGTLATVGCKKGQWMGKACRTGTRVQRVMVPKARVARALMARPGMAVPPAALVANPMPPFSGIPFMNPGPYAPNPLLLMNFYAGHDPKKALAQARANAARGGSPRYLITDTSGNLRIEFTPPTQAWAGVSSYTEVLPDGTATERETGTGRVIRSIRGGSRQNPLLMTVFNPAGYNVVDRQRQYGRRIEHLWERYYILPSSMRVPMYAIVSYHRTESAAAKKVMALTARKGPLPSPNRPRGMMPPVPSTLVRRNLRRNPVACPFRKGQKVPLQEFRAWARTNRPDMLREVEKGILAYKRFHLGPQPTSVTYDELPLGGTTMLPVEVLYSAGHSEEERYTPPDNSGKAPHRYVHKYDTQPEVLVGGGGRLVIKPLRGTARVTDWFRG